MANPGCVVTHFGNFQADIARGSGYRLPPSADRARRRFPLIARHCVRVNRFAISLKSLSLGYISFSSHLRKCENRLRYNTDSEWIFCLNGLLTPSLSPISAASDPRSTPAGSRKGRGVFEPKFYSTEANYFMPSMSKIEEEV